MRKSEKDFECNMFIVSPIMLEANILQFTNFASIMESFSKKKIFIEVYDHNIKISKKKSSKHSKVITIMHHHNKFFIWRVLNLIFVQLKISYYLIKFLKEIDLVIFFMGDSYFIPSIIAKLARKKTLITIGGFLEKEIKYKKDYLAYFLVPLKKINLRLSSGIVLYSKNLIIDWNLEKFENKIFIAHEHYLNFDKFKIINSLNERDNLIGYIGRLSEEKGIMDFLESIPLILKKEPHLKFLIAGEGPLEKNIHEFVEKNNLKNKITIVGWINHELIPLYLNKLKLFVLPSYTEGLPNIILESMACGTPVLSTNVGSINDFITDGVNGFIINENSSNSIAKNVIRVFEKNKLEKTALNAYNLVKKEYSYKNTLNNWKELLGEING